MTEELRAEHPLAETTERLLRAAQPDSDGILRLPAKVEGLDVEVSPASLPRAMALVRTFLRKATAAGIAVRAEPRRRDPRFRTIATVASEDLAVRLHEHRRQQAHKLTAEERTSIKRGGFLTPPKWDYRPSGVLSISVQPASGAWSWQTWTDRRRATLEQQLDRVLAAMREMAAKLTADRHSREAERVASAERERLAAIERERQRQDQEWAQRLLADAEAWRQSKVLRRYVQAVTQHVLTDGSDASKQWLEGWRPQALGIADQLDPIPAIDAAVAARIERRSGAR